MALTKLNFGGNQQALVAANIPLLTTDKIPFVASHNNHSIAHASTTSETAMNNGDTSFKDHITVTFTTTQISTVQCIAQFAHGWENGPANVVGRFDLDGTSQSQVLQVFKQGVSSNFAFGSHNMTGFFTNVSVGSHTIKLQVRNTEGNSGAKMNYFDHGGNGDHVWVMYK